MSAQDSIQYYSLERAIQLSKRLLQEVRTTSKVAGITAGVARPNGILWQDGFGYADAEKRVPINPSMKFRIASLSKILTAAGLARLYQEGRIHLDTSIMAYLPDLPPAFAGVTARQLAGHTSGVRHYIDADFKTSLIDFKNYPTIRDALPIFIRDPLVFAPGTNFQYSTFGFTLLSAVMEVAGGENFLTMMQREVFNPLGMYNTLPNHPDSSITNMTLTYQINKKGNLESVKNSRPSYKWAGGGYLSTVTDLLEFGRAHLNPSSVFFSEQTKKVLFTPTVSLSGNWNPAGLGWFLSKDIRGRRHDFHSGSQTGARAMLALYPEQNLIVSMLSNTGNTPVHIETVTMALADYFDENQAFVVLPDSVLGEYYFEACDGSDAVQEGFIYFWRVENNEVAGNFAPDKHKPKTRLPMPVVLYDGTRVRAYVATPDGVIFVDADPPVNGRIKYGKMTYFQGNGPRTLTLTFKSAAEMVP
ncbi:MAG: beta-lactamase family protein [Saprospiraceae bacterium]|nr:beta-lactamase family protein [Saprospiraceae bacterium]